MDFSKLKRNADGYIILDDIVKHVEKVLETEGTREKEWYLFDDDKVLFKRVRENTYEDYAELLIEEIFKQANAKTAEYDLAILNGKKGVITKDFRKKGERLISGKLLLKAYSEFIIGKEQNGYEKPKEDYEYYNLKDIEKALKVYNENTEEVDKMIKDLYLLFSLDCLTLQTDRHWTNWEYMIDVKTNTKKIAPQYDAGGACRFQLSTKRISSFNKNFTLTSKDNFKRKILYEHLFPTNFRYNSLRFDNKIKNLIGIKAFEHAYREEPEKFKEILEVLKKCSSKKAIEEVQKRIGCEIPNVCKLWFSNVIDFNQKEIDNFSKQKISMEENDFLH